MKYVFNLLAAVGVGVLLAAALHGCKFFDSKYQPAAELAAHVAACNAAAFVLMARDKSKGYGCEQIKGELEVMLANNADCLYYSGDAGVHIKCHASDGGTP